MCVGTPSGIEGEADMSQVKSAAQSIGRHTPAGHHLIVVNKSTMPIGTGDWMLPALQKREQRLGRRVHRRQQSRVPARGLGRRRLPPTRIASSSVAPIRPRIERVASLYRDLQPEPPIIVTDIRSAEMIKYASNAFLATKISFINEIASICERLGADVKEVARGMGLDERISPEFLDAGVGYGGSCFPKDVKALAHMASMAGAHPQLLRAVMEINRDMRRLVLQKVRAELGGLEDRVIGVLGLAFKPNTDDLREAPAIEIIHLLQSEGARVKAYDPAANEAARSILPGVSCASNAYEVAEGADALLLLTPVERVPSARPGSDPSEHALSAAGRRSQPVRPARDGRAAASCTTPSAAPRPKDHPCPIAESTPEAELRPTR